MYKNGKVVWLGWSNVEGRDMNGNGKAQAVPRRLRSTVVFLSSFTSPLYIFMSFFTSYSAGIRSRLIVGGHRHQCFPLRAGLLRKVHHLSPADWLILGV